MPLKEKYSIICDEVRQEMNGKFLILGMYVGNIAVPQLPVTLSLTLFSWLVVDRLGGYTLRVKIESAETGRVLTQAMVMLQIEQAQTLPAPAVIAPRFANVQFDRAGSYNFTMTVEGDREPIVIMPFDLVLVITQQQAQQPAR